MKNILITIAILFFGLKTMHSQTTITFSAMQADKLVANAGSNTDIASGESVTLGENPAATGGTKPYSYSWNNGSTVISTDANPLLTPIKTTTYSLVVTDKASCTATANTTINSIPVITSIANSSRCGEGTVTLKASASSGDVNWYANETGTTILETGTSFTTPSISSTTIYYAEAIDNGKTSSSRYAVTASIKPVPEITETTDISRCGEGVVTLKATASAGTTNWYETNISTEPLTTGSTYSPNVSTTRTYYVAATNMSCTSATRTSVTATINTVPSISNATGDSRNDAGEVSLQATANIGKVHWYNVQSGGNSIASGNTYTTTVTTTTVFYVDAISSSCTTATRTPVVATINNSIPVIISIKDSARCGEGTVTLEATASSGDVNWYANDTGTDVLETGTSFTTPTISTTTIYYAEANDNGKTSSPRTAVTATILPVPEITETSDSARCGEGTVTLGAKASSGTINWYASDSDKTSIGKGESFKTPQLTATTTYYVDATQGECTSEPRIEVVATINNCTSGSIDNIASNSIKVYPNPTTDKFFIQSNADIKDDLTISIYDNTGRILYSSKLDELLANNMHEIDISALTNGIYILQINNYKSITIMKIIKQ